LGRELERYSVVVFEDGIVMALLEALAYRRRIEVASTREL
jgi:hypothetical protein